MKINWYKIIVTALGCCLAIAVAMLFKLENSISAGIIAILSIQDTKKETLKSAFQRLSAFIVALGLAFCSFTLVGYNVLAFGVFLLPFSLFCYATGISASIPICAVLVSHFLIARHMEWNFVMNECLLMLLGTVFGVGLNLFIPRRVKEIRKEQQHIETLMKAILQGMAKCMIREGDYNALKESLVQLSTALNEAQERALSTFNNTLYSDTRYYMQYVDMRKNQYGALTQISEAIPLLSIVPAQAFVLARYFSRVAASLHEYNNAKELLKVLGEVKEGFRQQPLPQNRDEFEARALLYRMMIDMEYLLRLKEVFVETLTPEQKKLYFGKAPTEE